LKNNFEAFLGQAGADPHFLMSAKEANRRDLGVVHTQRNVDEDSLGSRSKVLTARIAAGGLPGGELSCRIRKSQYRLAIEKMSLALSEHFEDHHRCIGRGVVVTHHVGGESALLKSEGIRGNLGMK
jgi:hypothetical protein